MRKSGLVSPELQRHRDGIVSRREARVARDEKIEQLKEKVRFEAMFCEYDQTDLIAAIDELVYVAQTSWLMGESQ